MLRWLRREASALRVVVAATSSVIGKQWYRGLSLLGAAEAAGGRMTSAIGAAVIRRAMTRQGRSTLRTSARLDPAAEDLRARFRNPPSSHLLHANLIVLKSYKSPSERGVLLLKYSEVINAFALLFDVEALQQRYHLVLEPSTSGYMQPSTWLIDPTESVVAVQAPHRASAHNYTRLGFLPLDVSDGDWVDEQTFMPIDGAVKRYDFAMIANVIPLKRHAFVFDALRRHWRGPTRFALITSRWVGSGIEELETMLRGSGLREAADLFVDVSQHEVNRILNESRCHVLASEREGANRASLEALFAGIPALVPEGHVGFPHHRYDRRLVPLYRDGADLVEKIRECRGAPDAQLIASAARRVAGSLVATEKVNEAMQRECLVRGEEWTLPLAHKVTRVHCCYADPAQFALHRADYEYLSTHTRDGFAYDPDVAQPLLTR